jgi:ABC-type branched-subunit amino acid transport system substrate-binding protein
VTLATVGFLGSCAEPPHVTIGDAFTRAPNTPAVPDLILPILDSLADPQVSLSGWSLPEGHVMVRAAEQAARFAGTRGLIGVVGHAGSRDALLAANVYQTRGVPNVVPNATTARLALVGPWIFPLAPNDSVEGTFLANYAVDTLGARRIVVFYVGDEYGAGIRDGVRAALSSRGVTIDDVLVAHSVCHSAEFAAMQQLLVRAAIARSQPDVAILAVGADGGCLAGFIDRARPGTWILGADGATLDSAALGAIAPERRDRIRRTAFWKPGDEPSNRAFLERARSTLGTEPTDGEVLIYDAFSLLATAVREGASTRWEVRAWLESLGRTRPPFAGVSGPISFDRGRRIGGRLFLLPVAASQ